MKTIHIHSKLKDFFRNLLHVKTSSKHKELTMGGNTMHSKHAKSIKNRLIYLNIDPFARENPKSFSSGVEISQDIVKDMLRADELGRQRYVKFVKDRLFDGATSFFETITKVKLKTGMEKTKKETKSCRSVERR